MPGTSLRKLNLVFTLLFLVMFIASSLYIVRTWSDSVAHESQQALLISKIAATGIDGEMIKQLRALPEDESTVAFQSVKKRLETYLQADNHLRFVYLYTQRNDHLYFLADSEAFTSPDYSPPGQEYAEADPIYREPFATKDSLITKPITDRWGEWISVLTPLINAETGEAFAVLGMDYPASYWSNAPVLAVVQAVVEMLVALLLLGIIFLILRKIVSKEEKFSSLLKNIPGAAFRCRLDKNWTMEFISDQIEAISGFSPSDFIHNAVRSYASIIYAPDVKKVANLIAKAVARNENYTLEYRLKNRAGRLVWIKENGRAIYDHHGRPIFIDGIILDISQDREIVTEIKNKQTEIERMNRFMVDRELKMIELKKQVNQLKDK